MGVDSGIAVACSVVPNSNSCYCCLPDEAFVVRTFLQASQGRQDSPCVPREGGAARPHSLSSERRRSHHSRRQLDG